MCTRLEQTIIQGHAVNIYKDFIALPGKQGSLLDEQT